MAFDFELHFTGICLFAIDSYKEPARCDVLLVNTEGNPHKEWLPASLPPHAPRLVVGAKNFVQAGARDWKPDQMTTTPNGEDCLVFYMEGKDIRLDAGSGKGLTFNRTSPRLPTPIKKYSSQDRSFYYTLKVPHLDTRIKGLGPTSPGTSNAVIARFLATEGKISCFDLGRKRGDFMVFDFKTVEGLPAGYLHPDMTPRGIADRLVLRIDRSEGPILIRDAKDDDLAIGIRPVSPDSDSRELVQASLTNLDSTYHGSEEAIYDFLWYYTLFEWVGRPDGSELAIPWPRGYREAGRTPSSGTCPPGSG